MSTHCQAMSDWFELSIRHSVIYDEIIMTYPIHGWSPLCSTEQGQATDFQPLVFFDSSQYFPKMHPSFLILALVLI